MRGLFFTSDPYEPSGLIGLYETEDQKQSILAEYRQKLEQEHKRQLCTVRFPGYYAAVLYTTRVAAYENTIESHLRNAINALKDIEIPIGKYGIYE